MQAQASPWLLPKVGRALDSQLQAFRDEVGAELERASTSFHQLLEAMSADLRRQPTVGTKWSNDELLFHMMFGYMIVWSLIGLVKFFSRMPIKVSVIFATLLNVFTGPFNTANYLGSRVGARIYPPDRMGAKFDRVVKSLRRRLAAEREDSLRRQMCFPARWDPFFKERMSLADVYRYPTQHFDFHRRQLSGDLGGRRGGDGIAGKP